MGKTSMQWAKLGTSERLRRKEEEMASTLPRGSRFKGRTEILPLHRQ